MHNLLFLLYATQAPRPLLALRHIGPAHLSDQELISPSNGWLCNSGESRVNGPFLCTADTRVSASNESNFCTGPLKRQIPSLEPMTRIESQTRALFIPAFPLIGISEHPQPSCPLISPILTSNVLSSRSKRPDPGLSLSSRYSASPLLPLSYQLLHPVPYLQSQRHSWNETSLDHRMCGLGLNKHISDEEGDIVDSSKMTEAERRSILAQRSVSRLMLHSDALARRQPLHKDSRCTNPFGTERGHELTESRLLRSMAVNDGCRPRYVTDNQANMGIRSMLKRPLFQGLHAIDSLVQLKSG